MLNRDLIMQLTLEQGPGRETQVQPPLGVWAHYFDIDLDDPPNLSLINRKSHGSEPEDRPVVEHDHNWTVEVTGAEAPRPAIIRFRRTAANSYEYWIFTIGDAEYAACRWILDNFPNPHRQKGRLWLII